MKCVVLVTELGVQRNFLAYRQTVRLPDSDQVLYKALTSERAFAETRSRHFFETAS